MPLAPVAAAAALATSAWCAWDVLRAPELPRPVVVPGRSLARAARAVEPVEPAVWTVPPEDEPVDFDRFAFPDYDPPELRGAGATALVAADFPDPVRVLDGQSVRVEGYPRAAAVEDGRVTRLLLTRFPPGCCYGALPVLDEWIDVEAVAPLEARGLPVFAAVVGRLEVGERSAEGGGVHSLYRMTGARLVEP